MVRASRREFLANKVKKDYTDLLARLGQTIEPDLLTLAFTHRSFAKEQVEGGKGPRHNTEPVLDNERLEFLGDSVVQMACSEYLFNKHPGTDEDGLTKMRANVVSSVSLAEIGRELSLGDYLFLGYGEEVSGGREKDAVLADTVEAVFGAIFVEHGYDKAAQVVKRILKTKLDNASGKKYTTDWKTPLQELASARKLLPLSYQAYRSGSHHAPVFYARIYLNGELFGIGEGSSRRIAEQTAARQALGIIRSAPRGFILADYAVEDTPITGLEPGDNLEKLPNKDFPVPRKLNHSARTS